MATNQKKRAKKTGILLIISLLLSFPDLGWNQTYDWEPLPWGLTIEGLNSANKARGKTGQIREDKERVEIELQYTPGKSLRISRGELVALVNSPDPSMAGNLFGYSYEGKFFGQVFYYKDHPGLFPETVIGLLKKKYPLGATNRSFGATRIVSVFEFKSDKLYVFTSERAVFFYDPLILEGVVIKFAGQADRETEKFEKKLREPINAP